MKKFNSIIVCFLTASFLLTGTASAKDIFVSPSGDDSISYAENDIDHPWESVEKAFTNVQAGDNVYFRTGDYSISSTIETKYGVNGTNAAPITFSNYSDDSVTFTSSVNRAIYIDRNYYHISGINFSAPGTFWYIGKTYDAINFELSDCEGEITAAGGGENLGCVRFHYTTANNGRIENCKFVGPGPNENINTAGIFVFRAQGIKILHCEFSNLPRAVYYKHTCIPEDTGIEFAYNYFYQNGTGIATVSQYAEIHNNLFVDGGLLTGFDGGTGDDGNNAGSDHNNIYNNTFYNCTIDLIRQSSNDGSGAQYNIIKNNIFTNTINIFQYESAPHYTIMDYNLYNNEVAIRNNRTNYSLSSWQAFYKQDEHSLAGTPKFISDAPSVIEDYSLDDSSIAKNSGSSGKDMGADISQVTKCGPSSNLPVIVLEISEKQNL